MIKKLIIFLVLIVLLAPLVMMPAAFAAGEEEAAALEELGQMQQALKPIYDQYRPLLKEDITNCINNLTPLFDAETLEFLQFLEINFQNKSSNDSLTNIAIARYRQYRNNLRGYLSEIRPKASTGYSVEYVELYGEEVRAFGLCEELTESYIDLTKQKMIEHIKKTNAQKKSTIFVEKYRSINDGLRELNFAISQMYSHFLTFKNKLPGFICSQCVTN